MTKSRSAKITITHYVIIIIIFWSAVISASLAWSISNEKKQSYALALHAARASFNKDTSIRTWASKHGGVYVPPTESTPPNPWLAHIPNRDIVTTDGMKLTLMNPAYMIREMMNDYAKTFGISGRIVGQVALNPNNIADQWESDAIDAFKTGKVKEVIEQTQYKGELHLRLIRPFMMKNAGCVKCHGHLGFKLGDVRGAVGISLPMKPYIELGEKSVRFFIMSHLALYLLGLLGISIMSRKAYQNIAQRKKATNELAQVNQALEKNIDELKQSDETVKRMNENLEQQVQDRTAELEGSLTNLKNTQTQLIESEKMASLGSLVAGVAHELNTPVGTSITGVTHIQDETHQVLKAFDNGQLGKHALKEYLENVVHMTKAMHTSLSNAATLVRSFKQVAIDQHIEDKRHFNLKAYCDDILNSLSSQYKKRGIHIQNDIDPTIEIFSYAGIYSQIITNFIINSLLHGFDEKTTDGKIILNAHIDGDSLLFTYKDNGKGIDASIIDKIFDPFFTTNLGGGGNGLGLNIIYNLVNHKLHGTIKCKSQRGEGIKMLINIPLNELRKT